MPIIDTATGARLYYDEAGTGEPLIAIHGMLGTGRTDLGDLIDWVSADYHVFAPTMRGYGESTPKPRDFPLDFYNRDALDVLAFMDALNIERAHIIGYSDGGETALIAAGLAPERFKTVAVWGAVGYFGPLMLPVIARMNPATWLEEDPDTMALHGITDANAFALSWTTAVRHMIDSGGDVSLSLAEKITAPLLVMLGTSDTLNPQEYGQQLVDRAPNGRLVMFETGHPIHQQAPEDFQRVLGEFLRAE